MQDSYLKAFDEHCIGNLDLAETRYKSILDEDPNNCEVLHLLAILLSQRQDFLGALTWAEKALSIKPDSDDLHNTIASILQNLNQNEDAFFHYRQSLKLNPDNASSHNNLGNLYYRLGRLDNAKIHYQKAICLRSNYVDAYYNLSLLLIKQGLRDEAMKLLISVLKIDPSHIEAHNNLACLLQLQGEVDMAVEHYQSSLRLSDHSVLAHHNLGVIFAQRRDYEQAISHFKKTLVLQPTHLEALHNLGAILLLQKKYNDALPYFLSLSNLGKEFDVYYNLGVIYQELGRLNDAIVYFNEALKIVPDSFDVSVNLGAIYLQHKNFDKAKEFYLKALEISPGNEEIIYILSAVKQDNYKSKAPVAYLKSLFNQYAPYFDQHLSYLEHKSPELLFKAVFSLVNKGLDVLDLGCGTGIVGAQFVSIARNLIGIDISEKMLEVASKKNIYSMLVLGEIEEFLLQFSQMDLVIAADTLVYFGNLDRIFNSTNQALKRKGLFAFTIEVSEEYPYRLQRTARFAHSFKYIKELSDKYGFIFLKNEGIILRKHGNEVIKGFLCVLQRV